MNKTNLHHHFSNFSVVALFFVCLFQGSGYAQDKQTKLVRYFSALRENRQFNGNVLVAEGGKTVYEHSFGYADFAGRHLNDKNTLFPIASVSKTLTATAILQLAESGKLRVTDPVTKYLPGFPYPLITIRHLLSHTSGLPPYNAYFDSSRKAQPDKVFTNADFMMGLTSQNIPLIYTPGTKGNYDNINYIILALILEQVSGMGYSDYIDKNILLPAGMVHTRFFPLTQQYAAGNTAGFAFPHLYPHLYSDSLVRASTVPYVKSYWKAYNFHGFADYVSTVTDLLKYDRAYRDGRLLKNQTIEEAFRPVKLNSGEDNPELFGLGWEVEPDTSLGKLVYHSGMATGLSCILLRNITKDQTVIVFDNSHYNAHEIALKALQLLNDRDAGFPTKSIARIYAGVLLHSGADAAKETLYRLKKDTAHYYLSEDEMNALGYDFLGGNNNPNPFHFPEVRKLREAVETFKLNHELFPESWNVYDSYGEALLRVGRNEEAIRMYKRSIELNPRNEGGQRVLEQLLKSQ